MHLQNSGTGKNSILLIFCSPKAVLKECFPKKILVHTTAALTLRQKFECLKKKIYFDRKKTTKNIFCLKKSLNSELSKINNSCWLKAVRFCEVVFFLRSSTHSPPTQAPTVQPRLSESLVFGIKTCLEVATAWNSLRWMAFLVDERSTKRFPTVGGSPYVVDGNQKSGEKNHQFSRLAVEIPLFKNGFGIHPKRWLFGIFSINRIISNAG